MRQGIDGLSHQIVVLTGVQRDTHIVFLTQWPRPHATAVHDVICLNGALISYYSSGFSALHQHFTSLHTLEYLNLMLASALGKRHGQVNGISGTVTRHENAAQHIFRVYQRPALLDFIGGQIVRLDTE